jgi:hypothetical protein
MLFARRLDRRRSLSACLAAFALQALPGSESS